MSVEEKLEPHKLDKKASECVPYGVHAATIGTNPGYTIEKFSVN